MFCIEKQEEVFKMLTGVEMQRMEGYISSILPHFDSFLCMLIILIAFGIFTYYVSKKDTGIVHLSYAIFSVICASSILSIFNSILESAEGFIITMILFFVIMAVLGVIGFIKKVR